MAQVIPQETSDAVLYVADRNFGLPGPNDCGLSASGTGGGGGARAGGTGPAGGGAPGRHRLLAEPIISSRGGRPPAFVPDVYLFTTLTDEQVYSIDALCHLYCQRWNVEVHFRHVKTALEMESLTCSHSDSKELAAGLLTYNLICVLMTQAALRRLGQASQTMHRAASLMR